MKKIKKYYTLEKHQLKERTKYNFCPFCYRELKANGVMDDKIIKDPATIQTLWYTKVLIKETTEQGGEITYTEETYQCSRCKRKEITVDDFEKTYCKEYNVVER